MNLASKKTVKDILRQHSIRPSKRFGQNFLIDEKALRDIVAAAELSEEDVVLEIGPGVGTLTQKLALRAKRVIAAEKDAKMVEILRGTLVGFKNIEIVEGDILKLNPKRYTLNPKRYKVVANLPYYIVSPVIRVFLEAENPPKEMVLMVQKEVAQRICAKPPHINLLAVSVQFYAEPKIIRYVKKTSFWPRPKVDSAIIKIVPRKQSEIPDWKFRARFFKIVKAGFSQPRKQLLNNFSAKLNMDRGKIKEWLSQNAINPTQRAETLRVEDWIRLAKSHS